MTDEKKREIADHADMIINGFAFSKMELGIRIVNLNSDGNTVIISPEGKVLESCMNPIEEAIALDIWKDDSEFMEVMDA